MKKAHNIIWRIVNMFLVMLLVMSCTGNQVETIELSPEQKKICEEHIKDYERSQISKIQKCLFDGMKINPNLSGSITTVVNIEDGQYVIKGDIENTFNSKPVVSCMQEEIKTWKMTYPKEKDGTAEINCNKVNHEIPFSFKKSSQ